jgi:uncharacterized RDD family membrane protein YckC
VDTVLGIDTPEHLAFRVRIAGPARRFFAWLLDTMVTIVIFWMGALVVGVVFASVDLGGVGSGFLTILAFLLYWFYSVGFELLTGGRSPGKMWLKLRVVREDGLPITWRESILRNLLRAVDTMVLGPSAVLPLGPIVMAFDPKFRRLGDFVAGTIVVVEEPPRTEAKRPLPPDPELVEQLPGTLPVTRDDLEALELFVHRDQLSDARREELARIVAPELARRLGLPEPKNATVFLASLWARAQDPRRRIA